MSKAYVVKSLKQLLALASPGREEIIDAIGLLGPSTVPDLAQFLGRSRNALYYHVRALRDAGLLIETRQSGRGTKATSQYDVPGRPLTVRYDLRTERARRAVIAIVRSRLQSASRGFLKASRSNLAVTEGPRRNLWVAHWKGWLSPAELQEFNQHLNHLVNMLRGGAREKGSQRAPYEFTFALAPVVSADLSTRKLLASQASATTR
jgi:DNA-binding transcriptional ArsR family regulator